MSANRQIKTEAFNHYTGLVSSLQKGFKFSDADAIICISQMAHESNLPKSGITKKVIEFFDNHLEAFISSKSLVYVLYLSQKLTFYQSVKQIEAAKLHAHEIISYTNDPVIIEQLGGTDSFPWLNQIQERARSLLQKEPFDKYRDISRNKIVRYLDTRSGKEKMAKFKKIENEIRSGLYELVTSKSNQSD